MLRSIKRRHQLAMTLGMRVPSVEPKAPNPISSSMLKQFDPSATDQVSTDVPPSSRCGRKHPAATRQN
jgi:hypothetical protein